MTGRLLTAREVADTLGVSAETVLRWMRRGELPAIRLPGGAIRFREDELDGWLAERAMPVTASCSRPTDKRDTLGLDNINGAAPRTRPAPGARSEVRGPAGS
jgi:excisionase family DNA binding protein